MECINVFAERLKRIMAAKGISQMDLSRKSGITNQAISLWLSGKREPKLSSLWALSEVFNCSIDYLVGKRKERAKRITAADNN